MMKMYLIKKTHLIQLSDSELHVNTKYFLFLPTDIFILFFLLLLWREDGGAGLHANV